MLNFKSSTSVQPRIRTPTCQVCLEPFDGKTHVPKILQCAHTVCESCIMHLEEQGRRLSTNLDPNQVTIPCPVCRTITQTTRCCIRTNYQLIDVVETFHLESTHNIAFINCTECDMIYHEKDTNICTVCSPINETATAESLVLSGISLHTYALCSTCLLNNHLSRKHTFVHLQPLRIQMQREENIRRISVAQEKLAKVQKRFRDQLEKTMDKWLVWGGNHEKNMTRFRAASSSFQQKIMFDRFTEEISKKTEHIEKLSKHVQTWMDEMEKDMPELADPLLGPAFTSGSQVGGASARHVRPGTPLNNQQPPQQQQPHDNMVYYFEE